jgi:hypothetical protein
MQTVPKVTAVCINWNGGRSLRETVDSLLASDYPNLDILVVDNASTDNSTEGLPAAAGLLKLQDNTGYGEALNRGISFMEEKNREKPARFFLALNNDIRLETDTISGLVSISLKNGPGIYGPSIVRMDDPEILEAAWGILTWSHVLTRLEGENAPAASPPWNIFRKNVLLLGSVMLIHRDIFKAGILFDPLFFMYHEEVDFIYRAQQKGFPACYCPSVRARHYIGRGTKRNPLKKIYWTRRNSIYFLRKHGAGPAKWIKCLGTMSFSFLYNLAGFRFSRARAIAGGGLDGMRGISENHKEESRK